MLFFKELNCLDDSWCDFLLIEKLVKEQASVKTDLEMAVLSHSLFTSSSLIYIELREKHADPRFALFLDSYYSFLC